MLNGGCWIFLSHSSHDIEKVRMVRNEFERLGHNPLAFHLKCLSTETEAGRKELDDLIKREIDAREWFVFCESPAAERSQYVAKEHAYIMNSGKDKIWRIDMTKNINAILQDVRSICSQLSVYVSYSPQDSEIVKPLIDALNRWDYSVWMPETCPMKEIDYSKKTMDAIDDSARNGFFLSVITENSVNSSHVINELMYAYGKYAFIVPVIYGNPEMPDTIRDVIGHLQQIHVDPENPDYEALAVYLDKGIKAMIRGSH